MVSKDQAIGWVIFIVCVVIAIGYVVALFFPKEVGDLIMLEIKDIYHARIWLITIPVLIALIAILGIGAWIGWTMATTPPPRPIEEIEAEESLEVEKEKYLIFFSPFRTLGACMSKIKGLVLCGGKGTRLRPITYYFQKTMIPVGLKQKPLLEYVVRLLKFHGITDLTFLVDYKAEQVMNYFEEGSRFKVRISYIHDDPSLKGTAGSVLNAYRHGAVNVEDTLLVYYGDILTNMNLKDLLHYHKSQRSSATVALASGFTVRVGLADLNDDGKIRGFVEKPKLEKPVSIGILVFRGETLEDMELLKKEKRGLDLMGDVIPYLIKIGKPVYGYLSDAFWYDVVSTEAYEKLSPKLVEEKFREILGNNRF